MIKVNCKHISWFFHFYREFTHPLLIVIAYLLLLIMGKFIVDVNYEFMKVQQKK